MALARNGMRQPKAKNCSLVSHFESSRNVPPEKRNPIGRAELRKHPVPGAFARRRVFDRQQHRPAPFAAEPKPLPKTAEREQQRRGHADVGVGRAARRCRRWKCPWSAARRPAWLCGRCDRQNVRRAPSRTGARKKRWQMWRARRAMAEAGSDAGKNSLGKTSTAAVA